MWIESGMKTSSYTESEGGLSDYCSLPVLSDLTFSGVSMK
jgi:hypothetical protein